MKFVYYRSLAKSLNVNVEKLDKNAISQINAAAESYFKSNESLICDNQKLSKTDVFEKLDSFNNPSAVVFHDWIKTDKAISVLLQNDSESFGFHDKITNEKYKGHALEKQFYSFLTPFIFSILEKEVLNSLANKDFVKLRFFIQYADLIEETKKISLQQEVNSQLRPMFSTLLSEFGKNGFGEKEVSQKKVTETWNKNSELVKLLTSRDLVDILNLLDKQFYALRVSYIDMIKEVLVHPNIETATFKKISQEVNRLELNDAHKSQVKSFTHQSKSQLYQKQRTTVFNKALLRNPLVYTAALVIIVVVLLAVPFDFKKNDSPKKEKISGLDSLSIDEVKKTDSLLAYKKDSTLFETDDMTVPVALPDYILSDNSSEIKNETANVLYESMMNDYKIQQNNIGSNCKPLESYDLKKFNYENVKTLENQFSNHDFINESIEGCYILLFENKKDGAAFGKYVPSGGSTEMKIVKNWRVIFYSGKDFTSFNPLKISNNGYGNLEDAKKIDETFNTHFCQMDYSNFRILSKIYHVASIGKTTRLINNKNGALELSSSSIKPTK